MVRFGAHLLASREAGWEAHYVRFNELRDDAVNPEGDAEAFAAEWQRELDKVEGQFRRASAEACAALLSASKSSELARAVAEQMPGLCKVFNRGYGDSFVGFEGASGTPFGNFCAGKSRDEARQLQEEVLPLFERRRDFGLLNVEALRKLAKKLHKYVCPEVADRLFLELTTSQVANAISTNFTCRLSDVITECLRHPETDAPEGARDAQSSPPAKTSSGRRESVDHREGEFEKLCKMVTNIPQELVDSLVSHRGFHSTQDRLHRPLENTLTAYEQAWAAGIRFCECDINLTLDGELVLCHDDDLQRLARDRESTTARTPVTQLNFDELMSLPLKNGTHVPSLESVLRSAKRAGKRAGLVVEIKSGADGAKVAHALCTLLWEHRELLPHVEVVMSFDLYIIHNFNTYFQSAFEGDEEPPAKVPKALFLTKDGSEEGSGDGPPEEEGVEIPIDWLRSSPAEIRALVDSVLVQGSSKLSGIYVQFHPSMVEPGHPTAALLRELAAEHTIGVWGSKRDPDQLDNAEVLASLGAKYVNTDLPSEFTGWSSDESDASS